MDIILTIENFPPLSKSIINEGNVPILILEIANLLRSTFLLSNTLLHNNNFIIYCINQFPAHPNGLILFFCGRKLRYLAPDERGILFLFLKIHKIITGEGGKKQEKKEYVKFRQSLKAQSTPGIYVKKGDFNEIWEMFPHLGKDYVIVGDGSPISANLCSFDELDEAIHSKSVIVFNKAKKFVFVPPCYSSIRYFADEVWKAKFYESELISLIQSKITD